MQFAHFDGSLTPVPSIHDALVAIESRNTRRFVTQTELYADRNNDVYLPDVSDTVLSEGDFTESDANDAVSDWNSTEYGFYREDVTRRFQAKLLNVYRDKQTGALACGSIRIVKDTAGVTAYCVRCKVSCSLEFAGFYGAVDRSLFDYDLDLMQQFTRWVILHGNEHKARVIDDRIVERVIASRQIPITLK